MYNEYQMVRLVEQRKDLRERCDSWEHELRRRCGQSAGMMMPERKDKGESILGVGYKKRGTFAGRQQTTPIKIAAAAATVLLFCSIATHAWGPYC